jgi:hypothetical protein
MMKKFQKFWPSQVQWSDWSLPSKLTAIGTLIAVISLGFCLAEKAFSLARLFWPQNQREQLFVRSEESRRSIHSALHTAQSCELTDLVRLFVDGVQYWADWQIGAEPGTPIAWTTEGKHDDPPEGLGSTYGSFARHGTVVLTVQGKPAYQQLKQIIVPGEWNIWLVGPNAGVTLVMIESEYGSTQDLPIDISRMLRSAGFNVTLFKGLEERNTTGNFIIYHVVSPANGKAWLAESWSIGTAGGAQDIWIMWQEETANLVWEKEGHLGKEHLLRRQGMNCPTKPAPLPAGHPIVKRL